MVISCTIKLLSFQLESIQYRACLAITGAIRGTSREKIYQELGLESVQPWRKLAMKISNVLQNLKVLIFFSFNTEKKHFVMLREMLIVFPWLNLNNFFKNNFFPSAVIEWSKLNPAIWNAESSGIFKSNILKFIRLTQEVFFNCYNHKGIRLMTWLGLGLSHLREHKFNHNFQNCINPLCSCGMDIESTSRFFLHCPLFDVKRITLEHSKQNWLQKNWDEWIFFNRNANVGQIIVWFEKKLPYS